MESSVIITPGEYITFKGSMEQAKFPHGSLSKNYVPIGPQLTSAYYACTKERDRLKKELTLIKERFEEQNIIDVRNKDDKESLERKRKLESELDNYIALDIMVDTYTRFPQHLIDYNFILHGFSYIWDTRLPSLIYSYLGAGDEKFSVYGLKDIYQDIGNIPKPEKVFYEVKDDFGFCLATLDYLCSHRMLLRKCTQCGQFFLAEHGRELLCSATCAEEQKREQKRQSANDPLRKAKKRMHDRINNKNFIKQLSVDSLHLDDTSHMTAAEKYIKDDNKAGLIDLIDSEFDRLKTAAQSHEELIQWLDKVGRERRRPKKGDTDGNNKA